MDDIVAALQGIVMTEPETETQPDPSWCDDATVDIQTSGEVRSLVAAEPEIKAQQDPVSRQTVESTKGVTMPEPEPQPVPQPTAIQDEDAAAESRLTEEISTLWTQHTELSGTRKSTAKELRLVRTRLAGMLYQMKALVCRPEMGRASQWRGWLRQQGIPRSTADRLVARHGEMLGAHSESVLSGPTSEQAETAAEKLAKSVWHRIGKLLTTGDSVIQFVGQIAELSGVGHEQRAEGLMIFIPVPEVTNDVPGSAPATDPAPQLSGEVPAITG